MSDNSDISRRAMLARLGLTASAIYTIPAVTILSEADASGSGGGGNDSDIDCSDNPSSPSCA